MESTLTKVGNSAAVIIPSALRREAGVAIGDEVRIESPRSGVIVITALFEGDADRRARLAETERRLADLSSQLAPWPALATADDLIEAGKRGRADAIVLP